MKKHWNLKKKNLHKISILLHKNPWLLGIILRLRMILLKEGSERSSRRKHPQTKKALQLNQMQELQENFLTTQAVKVCLIPIRGERHDSHICGCKQLFVRSQNSPSFPRWSVHRDNNNYNLKNKTTKTPSNPPPIPPTNSKKIPNRSFSE